MSMGQFIRQLRDKHDVSQAELAVRLGLSRPTVVQLEKDEHELTLTEAKRAADFFGITVEDLMNERHPAEAQVELPKVSPRLIRKPTLRIAVPQKKLDVFRQVLIYILNKVGAKPNVGETVLYKLLYFVDFDFYEKYEDQLIGATYIKNHFGPTPCEFKKITELMIEQGDLELVKSKYFDHEQRKYLPTKAPDLAALDARAVAVMDEVLAKYSDLTARQISELSHRDVPWITAQEGEKIDYESVFYRTPEFSVRKYGDEVRTDD